MVFRYLLMTRISLLRVIRALLSLIGTSVVTHLTVPASVLGISPKPANADSDLAAKRAQDARDASSVWSLLATHTPLVANDIMSLVQAYWHLGSRVMELARKTVPLVTSSSSSK